MGQSDVFDLKKVHDLDEMERFEEIKRHWNLKVRENIQKSSLFTVYESLEYYKLLRLYLVSVGAFFHIQ